MGLGKSVKRLLPATAALALGIGAIWYGHKVKNSQTVEVRDEAAQRASKAAVIGTGASLAALLAAYGIRRAKGKKEALMQSVVEHPYVASAATSASYCGAALSQSDSLAFSAMWGLMAGAGVFTLSRALKLVNPPYWKNYPACMRDSLITALPFGYGKKLNAFKRMGLYASDPDRVAVSLADLLFSNNRVDEGLDCLNAAVKANLVPKKDTVLEQRILNPVEHEIVMGMRSKHPLLRFYSHFRMGEVDEAVQALDDFVGDDVSPSKSAARAYVFQSLSEHEPQLGQNLEAHINRSWRDAISKILADPEKEKLFRPMGESRNEVLEYDANEFLKGLLVFKRCDVKDKQRLINERETVLELGKSFVEEVSRPVLSLAYVEHDGKAYHVTKHETNRTLGSVLAGAGYRASSDSLRYSARFLAQYHNADLPWESPVVSEDYYAKRLESVCYENLAQRRSNIKIAEELRASLEKIGAKIYDNLKDAPFGWYKDANWRNWLVRISDGGYSYVRAIDFEHRIRLPVQLDLVSLLESGITHAKEKEEALKCYFGAGRNPKDMRTFMQQYKWAAVQRHLELAGYRARDKEFSAVRFHITQARGYAFEVGEYGFAELLGKRELLTIIG